LHTRRQPERAAEVSILPAREEAPARRTLDLWIGAAIAVLTSAIYVQTCGNGFLVIDDGLYIVDNPHVSGGLTASGVAWAFTAFHACNWHPLTWLSHMLDVELFGLEAGAHHLVNALLHVANSLLVFYFLRRTTGARWPAAFAAALFAVHPLHVESVAWAAERKDTLSTLFALLCLLAYARWTEAPSAGRLGVAFAAFAAGLLAKPMLVTLPFVLLLLDFWPLGRLGWKPGDGAAELARRLVPRIREKVAFFALAVVASLWTLAAQRSGGAVRSLASSPLGSRIENALSSYLTYLARTFWPSDLGIYYPLPRGGVPDWKGWTAAAVLLLVTAIAVRRSGRLPWLPTGWFWFLGTLLPVIGLVQVGAQAMADRYHYLPSIGLFVAVAWAFEAILARAGSAFARRAVAAAAVVAVLALAAAAYAQTSRWRDDETIFRHTLDVTKDNLVIEANLGHALARQGRHAEAMQHFERAITIWPGFFEALFNMGASLDELGRHEEALGWFQRAVAAQPSSALARMEMGTTLERLGRRDEALASLRRAVELAPDDPEARSRLERLLIETGDAAEADR
jgi:Tfp pilus assembly protein PilF